MPYTPPIDGSIDYDISGLYTVPAGTDVNFDIGGTAPREILSANSEILLYSDRNTILDGDIIESANSEILLFSDKSFLDPVWPISTGASEIFIQADRADLEILPDIMNANAEVSFFSAMAVVRKPEVHDLPATFDSGITMRWEKGIASEVHKRLPWGDGTHLLPQVTLVEKENPIVAPSTYSTWGSLGIIDERQRVVSNSLENFDVQTRVPWHTFFILDHFKRALIGGTQVPISANLNMGYLQPVPKDAFRDAVYASAANKVEHTIPIEWNAPGARDTQKQTTWGPFSYHSLCGTQYWAPKAEETINFAFPSRRVAPAAAFDAVNFMCGPYSSDPRCPYQSNTSGQRDPFNVQTVEILNEPAFQGMRSLYYMLNFVFVREILSNTQIQVLAVEATIDRDSWLWQFNVTVASRECLEVIKPKQGIFVNIEININGWKWICTVENWRENRKFGKDAWTITGRSPSMMLGGPVAGKRSATISTGMQGQQIFDDVLSAVVPPQLWHPNLGVWESDWSIYNQGADGGTSSGFHPLEDWYVMADNFSYADQMPIEVLQSITGAIGAYIQTEADPISKGCKLKVHPMYPHQPWLWNVKNLDIDWKTVIDDQCLEIGRESVLKPFYEAVNVAGELPAGKTDGSGALASSHPDFGTAIFVSVYKEDVGPDTAVFAPMLTNKLVTSSKVGMELGRMTVGDTGQWLNHTLRLSTLCPPPSANAGVFVPGTMLAVNERGLPWYGQVTGTTIRAATGTGSSFVVEQTIAVEEYVGG